MARKIRQLTVLMIVCAGLSSSLFAVSPTITSLSPTSGAVGVSVTITGTNFGSTQGGSTVKFNGTTTTPTSWSTTSIKAPVPSGATTGNVVVTVGTASNGVLFTVAPSISSLSPTSGAVGASVTISGLNFGTTQGSSTVKFNGTASTPTSWGTTSIVAPVPTGATTGTIVVTVGGLASNGVTFTVVLAPSISSLSPTTGAVGASVTIAGTNFGTTQGTSTVKFNGTTATPTSWSATSIVAPVPSGATNGNVVVHASGVDSNGVSFTVVPAPSITSLSPTTGAVGASVTITGTNFGTTQGTSTVKFNGTIATPASWSASSIVAPVPTGATTGNVVVNASGVNSNGVSFTVVAAPSITSLSPTSGAVGAPVTINGTNFGTTQGTSTVSFNGTAATPTSWSATVIKAPVPSGATTGNVIVHASGVNSNGANFTVAPSISSVSPTTGAVGASVTISGLNFGTTQGSSTVKFNGTASTPTSWGTTSIVAPVPTGGTTGNIVVTVGALASNGVSFTVVAAPSISSLSPPTGAVGASVTITGTNFGTTQGTGTVSFNGTAATPGTWSATSIVVPVPSGASTGNVLVHASGVNSNGVSFTVVAAPSITSLSPTTGAVGASVTITGANFGTTQGTSTVKFNGTTATPSSWSATSIVAPLPSGATTGNVVVNASGVNSNGVSFTVVAAPSITSLSPTTGAVSASVTITGTNFGTTQGTSTVSFNGTAATPTSWSATSIVVPVPSGATTGNVVVNASGVNSNGVSLTVVLPPNISSLSQGSGAVGASVTIGGGNFGATQGSGTVTFNGTVATTITSWSAGSIVAAVPSGATTGNLVVTASGVASNGVAFTVTPSITSLSPTSGGIGMSVTITGSNFGSSQGTSIVQFSSGQTTATPTSWSATSIVTPVPAVASTGLVSVNVGGNLSNGLNFTVLPTPTITTLSPNSGPIGTWVTITGTNFGATQASSTVTFNGTAATTITSWSASSIALAVPPGTTTGNVVVTVGGVPSAGTAFTKITAPSMPSVVQVRPVSGASNVALNSRVILRFSQPVLPISVVNGVLTLTQGSSPVVGSVAQSNDGLSLTFIPSQNLTVSASYTVSVVDVAAGQTTPQFQSTFTTGTTTDATGPQVVQLSPPSAAAGVPINAPLVVQFTKPMDPSTLTPQAFSVTDNGVNVAGMVQVDPTGLTASFVPSTFFGVGHNVAANLASTIRDASGNSLPAGSAFSFTTSFSPDSQGPSLIGTSPSNGVTGVPLNSLVVLEFNKPLNVISVSAGFQVLTGGQPVSGGIALSDSNKRITFTPNSSLTANTSYTVTTTSSITDVGGFPITNPGSSTFTTGSATDATTPSVVVVVPASAAVAVPTNAVVQVQFSKAVNPLTVTAATLQLTPQSPGNPVPGAITVSPNGQIATLVASAPLVTTTKYVVTATNGITDLEGHALPSFSSNFTTGLGPNTTAPTVVTISPQNGATGVPVNLRVDVVMSVPLSVASVGSNAVTVLAGGTPVTGTVTLSSDGTTLTFAPSGLLATSTVYTVTVSGVTDQAGNTMTSFTSTFTTSTSGTVNTTQPSVVSVSPTNGATAVSVSTPIVLTFNEAIDGSTVNNSTVPISISAFSGVLAGSYSLNATSTVLTFTPASPLPGNTSIRVQVNSSPTVLDLSGNQGSSFFSSFTTAATADTTPPTVVMVTPSNGATNIGLNGQVVLTFSESLNPTTITANNFGLFANGSKVAAGVTNSADNRVVTIIPSILPASSTVAVVVTGGVQDLSGNALGNFTSQFTTAAPFDTTYASVVAQRPGNGAIGVPLSTNVVLYINEAMNSSTVQGAVHVSQNGVLVNGTTQVTDNGQVVQFTPSAQWQPGAAIQVFLDSTALDLDGVAAANYQGSFTTVPNNSATAPTLLSSNPPYGATGVPTNVVMDMAYNQPLNPATLSASSIACYQNGVWFQSAFSLLNGGTLLQVVPRSPLLANTTANCLLSASILGTNGIPIANGGNYGVSFTTGSGPDSVVPTIVSVSPPNGSSNVGDNAIVRLVFSKPVNPLTINASTIQLSGGGTTAVPDSISFSNNNQSVLLTPHAPLPDSTQMTLVISGITDVAGNAVAPQTTQFTTGNGPDLVKPFAVNTSPFNNATNVPVNAVVMLQVNEPIDPGTVNSTSLLVKDAVSGQSVAGTYSVSSDGQTVTFLPAAALTTSHLYSVSFTGQGIADLAGNLLTNSANASDFGFTTGTTSSTNAPQVVGTSPANGATAIPTNAQVMIQFNEPVDAAKLTGVTLTGGSGAVNVSQVLSNGNQTLTLIPALPLSASTTYTVTIAGVQDLSGNALVSPVTTNFTTAAGANLIAPTVASVNPVTGASGVATNTAISVQFAYPINPLTVTNATFQVYPNTTTIPVAGSIAVSTNGLTATFTPSQPLDPSTTFVMQLTGGDLDLEGRGLNWSSYFTTTTGSVALAPTIVSLSQSSASVGTTVWLNGTYFGTSQGSSTVSFNGVTATPSIWSDTQVFVTVPSGATSGPVTITVNGLTSNGVTFNVLATPNITGVSPASGSAGNAITITGTNFGDSYDSVTASFSGVNATAASWNSTSIVVPIPASAPSGYVNLTVSVNNRVSSGVGFTVVPTPNIVVISPSSGVAGTPVTITGTNFGTTQGSSTVSFNGVAAASITSWSSGSIVAVPASNVTTGPVTMSVNSVPSNSNNVFTVTVPAIGNLTPPAAAVGAQVNVNGSGFYTQGQNTQVFFNGIPATIILYGGVPTYPQYGNNQLTVIVPQGAASGTVTVQVGGVTSNSSAFTLETPPTVSGIFPTAGQIGSTVLISGSGFGATQSSSSVSFYPGMTAQIVSWSDTSIQAIVPGATSTGVFNVQVGTLTAQGPSFQITNVTQLTDSLSNQSTYATAITAGSWSLSSSSGPGCSSCSVRGNTVETVDANGNVLTHTDDLGHVTTYTYDSNNNVTFSSRQLDANTPVTTSYTYNSFGEALTMTDALGNVTTNAYDTKGNLTSVTTPQPNGSTSASVTHFVYDTKGELTQITDALTNPTNITYTPAGLIATITDAQQHTTTYQYDSRGNRTVVIDPINGASHPTTSTYDLMNRLTAITYPDGSSVGFGYDYLGRRTSVTDQNQKTTTYAYDDADRLTSVTDPANNITQYAYDTEGNLTSITDANNHTTYFAYNARGWVTQTTFPSTLYETYGYDAVGNLQTKTDRKNQIIQYVYDALNRLTSKSYPDSTSANYVYDLVGEIKQVTDPTGTYGFAYDNMGRLIGTTTQYTFVTGTFSNAYTYDAASNRTSLTAPDGSISTYGYDTLNRLNGLANSWAGSFGFGYDALNRRTSLTRPNGVNTSYGYDSVSHLLSVLHQTGASTLDGAGYNYDAAGNRTNKTNYLNNVTEGYTYDALYQLTQVTQGAGTTESYSYDLVGNRLSSLGMPMYNYNASNELTSNSLGSYTYDNDGNTLTDAGGKTYTWDFQSRLASAFVPGTGTVTFKYDPLGRRIQKSSTLGTTNYLYDGANVVEERDSGGNLLAKYLQGANIDEPLAQLRASATTYYDADSLGSITSLTNSSGVIAASYAYDGFGNLSQSTGTVTNPLRYTGREFDSETGIYFYRARYYDLSTGRFINEDPLAFNAGLNFYDYVNGNPTNLADPTGLFGWSDVLPAWNHYCDGTGTPWTAPFGSIDWGNTQSNIDAKVKGMAGASCSQRNIPVSFNVNAQTAGADANIIGRHVVKVNGTIHVNCDCSWSFSGNMSSALGYDPYDFDPSNRGAVGEGLVWIGGHRCPSKGKPFNINLPGSVGLSDSGKINGEPTCKCKKKK